MDYENFTQHKKYCVVCGCIMPVYHDDDICECCLDDLYDNKSREEKIDDI